MIVTADDFGLDPAVNEAVEEAHRHGILTAASLMVAERAANDAVRRARRLPTLGVGLHLALTQARPLLPPSAIPHLVDRSGELSGRMVRMALTWCLPTARAELAREIAAQFEAFARTGLELDHVSVHQHLQVHPVVLDLILAIGQAYGVKSLRLPDEPVWAVRPLSPRYLGERLVAAPWLSRARARARERGLFVPDAVFGWRASGTCDEGRLLAMLDAVRAGTSEIYLHPWTRPTELLARRQPGYDGVAEYRALLSSAVRTRAAEQGIRLVRYRDLVP